MINYLKIKNHPAYKRASRWLGGSRSSYYLQVLHQNLHHFHEQVPVDPCEVDEQEVLRGTVFLVEEAIEYSSAKTLEDKLDALVDVVIVALGRAVFHGFHEFDEAMNRVVAANMQKVPGPSPGRGEWSRDLSKPNHWRPAWLRDLVLPSRIADSELPGDEPLDESETEVFEGHATRRLTEPHLEIADLIDERDRLIEVVKTHDQKENLSAKVITNLRGKLADLTIERDQANLDWGTMSDRLCEVTTERDEYQRQLRDEIGRGHALRGSNDNLRKRLFEAGFAGASPRDESSAEGSVLIDTQTLRRVISLRQKLKAQVPRELGSLSHADYRWMKLIQKVESVLADVELNADSPLRVPIESYYVTGDGVHETEEPPIKLDDVHPVLLECARLLVKKSQDYGSSLKDYSKAQYMPFGHYSYVHMLHTKLGRIRSVAIDRDLGQDVNFESLRDSVLDLINYAAFYGAWLEELEKTDVEERSH